MRLNFLKNQKGLSLIFIVLGGFILLIAIIIFLLLVSKSSEQSAQSSVFWNSKITQKVAKGEYISGKGIPNSEVEIIISPGNIRTKIRVDKSKMWSYKIPDNLDTGKYIVTISILDKYGTKTTEKSYPLEITSNKSRLFINLRKFMQPRSIYAAEPIVGEFPAELYKSYGFPPPNAEFKGLTEGEIYRWRKYYLSPAIAASKLVDIDMGLLGMWVYFENYMLLYQDNCFDFNKSIDLKADFNQNTYCPGWYKVKNGKKVNNWQVGWGLFSYEAAEDFRNELPYVIKILHPGKSIQQIGQEGIEKSKRIDAYTEKEPWTYKPPNDPITDPEFFPDVTLNQIIEGALPIGGDDREIAQEAKIPEMRQLYGILLKDEAIGAYILARHFKEVEKINRGRITKDSPNWSLPNQNLQNAINLIATLYSLNFDPDDVTITNVEDNGDGKVSSGEEIEVTSVCTRDDWEIAPEYCSREYTLKNKVSPEVKLLPGGGDCDKICKLTIPEGTLSGNYDLVVYVTKEGRQEILGSDLYPVVITNPSNEVQLKNSPAIDQSTRLFTDAEGNRIPFFGILLGPVDKVNFEQLRADAQIRLAEMKGFSDSLEYLSQKVTDTQLKNLINQSKEWASRGYQEVNACVQ